MVPRIAMVALEVNTPFDEALDVIVSAGHSRIPVYRGTIDEIVGILYAKDMLAALRDCTKPPLEKMLRPVYFTPESKRVIELLHELQKRRVHVSIVVDEYGGTAGLVTIEDILEEIVGEIQDEYDTEEPDIVPLPEGNGYILDAGMNIEDASELLKVELPKGESDTLGGFIYDQLGKVPVAGEKVEHGGFVFEVLAVNDRRILKVKVTHAPRQPDAPQQAAQARPRAADDAAAPEHNQLPNAINNAAAG
jgi:CBS domain containing-hemolysin-like protein